jgi:hypothetical protein
MRIPRKHITSQREVLQSIFKIKYIHYREHYTGIDSTNFQKSTKVDFKVIEQDPSHENIYETWGRLKHENTLTYAYTSKTKSQYIIDDKRNLYRFSNHWGAVASCEWTIEGRGQLMMSIFEQGEFEIGVASLKAFKIFRRSVDRKQDKILNPKWVEIMKTLIPTSKKLTELKYSPDFKDRPIKDKQFIGENYGVFKKELSLIKEAV